MIELVTLPVLLVTDLVLSGVFLLLNFGQCKLQVINILLELRAFILQLSLLGGELSIDFLFILQPLSCFLEFGLQLNLTLDKTFTSLLSIRQIL